MYDVQELGSAVFVKQQVQGNVAMGVSLHLIGKYLHKFMVREFVHFEVCRKVSYSP